MTTVNKKPRRPLPVVIFLYMVVAITAIALAPRDTEIWILMLALVGYTLGAFALARGHRLRLQKWKQEHGKKK